MTYPLRFLLLFCAASSVFASAQLDEQYGFHSSIPIVINRNESKIYSEAIEKSITGFFESHPRFEFPAKAYTALTLQLDKGSTDARNSLRTLAANFKAQALYLFQIKKDGPDARLSLDLVNVATNETIYSREILVEHPDQYESYGMAALYLVHDAIKKIPYDGSILKREDNYLVLDRGLPELHRGMRLYAQTVEKRDGKLFLEPTGTIVLTRVDKDISFGKVISERAGTHVTTGNKILLVAREPEEDFSIAGTPEITADRSVASYSQSATVIPPKGSFGSLEFSLGADAVSLNQSFKDGTRNTTGSALYPGVTLDLNAFVLGRIFTDVGFGFASGSTSDQTRSEKMGASLNSWRVLAGYRFGALAGDYYPSVDFKIGYVSQSFHVDPSTAPILFTSTNYSGIWLGGGIKLPVQDTWGLGFDLGTLLLGGLSESPVTSADSVTGLSGWDFALKGYYHYTKDLDLEAKLLLSSYVSQLSGTGGTRGQAATGASASGRAFLFGASYYF